MCQNDIRTVAHDKEDVMQWMQKILEVLYSWWSPTVETPPVVAPPPTQPPTNTVESKLVELHNRERTKPLAINSHLTKAAQGHADWMAERGRMTHRQGGGNTIASRITSSGYSWRGCGENIAKYYSSPEEVMVVWMNSSGHRRNIKNESFRDIGVGVAKDRNGILYWCVNFAF